MGKVQMVLGKLNFCMRKNEGAPFPYATCQRKLQTEQRLNLRAVPEVRRAGTVTRLQGRSARGPSPGRWPGGAWGRRA